MSTATKEPFKAKNGKTYDVLVLRDKEDSKFPFSFGLSKAKLILAHIEDIKQFVSEYDQPEE